MKTFKTFNFAFLLLLLVLQGFSQNLKLIGSIFNSSIKEPVLYANIAVRNMPIGTCSNYYGDFVLNLPDSLASGILDLSCIGFKSRALRIDSLYNIADTLLIYLEPVEYLLKDITVVPGLNDLQTIFKKVISRIDNNYTGKKYFMETFFRHRVYNKMESDRTVRLTEAAISIHENHTNSDNKKVQINEIRNSENYAELSTSIGRKLLYNALGGNQNPVYRSLHTERLVQKDFLKKLLKNEHYKASMEEVSFYDNQLVYVIQFKQVSWEFMFKKYYNTHTYSKLRYYINAADYAILKVDQVNISHNPLFAPFNRNDSVGIQNIIQYRKFEGKYYPQYVYFDGIIPDMIAKNDKKHFYRHEAEMLVNELATRRKDYDRIKYRNQMGKGKTLWDMEYEYNPQFWKNFNVLLEHPLNPEFKNDLEFEKTLEEQFNKKQHVEVRNN